MRYLKIVICSVFILFLMVFILIRPDSYIVSIKDGFLLFITKVAPLSFPFFFLSRMYILINNDNKKTFFVSSVFQKVFKVSKCGFDVFLLSILTGYPSNAKFILDYYLNNNIDENEAKKILTFSSSSRPIFIIGTIGAIFLNNIYYGIILYLSHVVSSLINGLIYRNIKVKKISPSLIKRNSAPIILDAMNSSLKTISTIGGFITFFYLFIDILEDLKIISIIENVLNCLVDYENAKVISYSLFEMTYRLSLLSTNTKNILPLVAGCISFGGISILVQSMAFLSKARIKLSFYLLTKTTQTIICIALTYLIILFA